MFQIKGFQTEGLVERSEGIYSSESPITIKVASPDGKAEYPLPLDFWFASMVGHKVRIVVDILG